MQQLEILVQLKKRFKKKLHPDLISVCYCQTDTNTFIQLKYASEPEKVHTFGLIYIIENESLYKIEEDLLSFNPAADVIDNTTKFINFDEECLRQCVNGMFPRKFTDGYFYRLESSRVDIRKP